MKKVDYAYIAGFFDGEGSIGITKRKAGDYQLLVSIGQANRFPLKWLQFNFGGCLQTTLSNKPHIQTMYRWRVVANDAFEFLTTIYPYLILKKAEAELAIKWQKAKQERRKGQLKPKTEEAKVLDEANYILMKSLKSRGKNVH